MIRGDIALAGIGQVLDEPVMPFVGGTLAAELADAAGSLTRSLLGLPCPWSISSITHRTHIPILVAERARVRPARRVARLYGG